MHPSERLIEFLVTNPLPWLSYSQEKQKLIMIVDNHLLSTYRGCQQHFAYAHIQGLKRRSSGTALERTWFLEFGICLHEMLEEYYLTFRNSDFDFVEFCSSKAAKIWYARKMDEFSEEKEYKLIGGLAGFVALLGQYATILSPENERIHILGTEVSFGKNLEVPLHIEEELEVYLSGRMDLIVDDGHFICPMDHKSFASFRGDVSLRYAVDEGPTGYIYALRAVLPKFVPEGLVLQRDCSKILMNFISKAPTADPRDRFKRIPLRKTEWQLEQYRLRMVDTAKHLLQTVENIAAGVEVSRNTQVCQNWFHRTCSYFDVCRQVSKDGELVTIQNGYARYQLWDTEMVGVND